MNRKPRHRQNASAGAGPGGGRDPRWPRLVTNFAAKAAGYGLYLTVRDHPLLDEALDCLKQALSSPP